MDNDNDVRKFCKLDLVLAFSLGMCTGALLSFVASLLAFVFFG